MLGMFLKIMQIIFIILALFAVMVKITQFDYTTEYVGGVRDAVLVTQAALSADCLTIEARDGYPVRGLFDQTKLLAEAGTENPSCMPYREKIYLEFSGYGDDIKIGDETITSNQRSQYPAALKTETEGVVPIMMTVYVSEESINECSRPGEKVCLDERWGNEVVDTEGHKYLAECKEVNGYYKIDRETVENCEHDYISEGEDYGIGTGKYCKCWYWHKDTENEAGCYDSGFYDTCEEID